MMIRKRARREGKRLFRYCLVNEVPNENRIRQIVQRVLACSYRDSPAVLAYFLHLLRLDSAARTAKIESATPLSPELKAAIQAALTRRYGEALVTDFLERPSLLGGVRIQAGCDVYDGTIRAKLNALETSF